MPNSFGKGFGTAMTYAKNKWEASKTRFYKVPAAAKSIPGPSVRLKGKGN